MPDSGVACELQDVHVVWSSDHRITVTEDERIKYEAGQQVCYQQSWPCMLRTGPDPAEEEDGQSSRYRPKPPPRQHRWQSLWALGPAIAR